ncbi:protein FAR-RED IMPAIRED RESPONSE 1-like [Neltuma alba]|uniref:protein FAR-RED IMPAIRED RESPONSE 1-like n=1 Tax=Neltuma alba TaxID=207710 RepID=UPI0010A3FA6E|nr:protein FAR-RED IMPAIRED RESPONSE 1-like [Prosopis alba]
MIICSFIKEHNHEIFPDQAYYFRGNGNLDLRSSNGDALQITRAGTKKMKAGNRKGSSGNHSDLNEEQQLRSVFWVDAKSRLDYRHFGDVILLDTTHIKNEYKLPVIPFIGVNHHYQFLLLGCAIVSDEAKSTYTWLLQTWLRAMGGCAPKPRITSQSTSISSLVPSATAVKKTVVMMILWKGRIPVKLPFPLHAVGLCFSTSGSVRLFCSCRRPLLIPDGGEEEDEGENDDRHVMIVLQISGVHHIPSQYILKRWTKEAKNRQIPRELSDVVDSRSKRFTNLYQLAFKLGDEGSLSQASYTTAVNALEEALRKCENMNNSTKSVMEPMLPILGSNHVNMSDSACNMSRRTIL